MSSNQAYYVQGWVVGAVAIGYLKVRETGIATPQQTETIAKWMQSVGEQTKGYYDAHKKQGHGDSQNNHLYWAGVELAAIGVTANDLKDSSAKALPHRPCGHHVPRIQFNGLLQIKGRLIPITFPR